MITRLRQKNRNRCRRSKQQRCQYASTAGSRAQIGSGMYASYAELREAISTLEGQNTFTFEDGFFRGISHPNVKRDLQADSQVLNTWQYATPRGADNPLITGAFDAFYKTKWMWSTNSTVYSSAGLSGADVYAVLIFGKEAYGLTSFEALPPRIYIVPRTASKTDPLAQYGTVGWKASLAAVILNQNFMVRLEVNSSAKTAA